MRLARLTNQETDPRLVEAINDICDDVRRGPA
jgi:hypothetical protein